MTLSRDPKVLMACPTWEGCRYSLKAWAKAFHSQTYENKGAFQVDNSNGPTHGGNLHYLHSIRAEGIPAVWQQTRFPSLWDTLELSWQLIVEYAHAHGYDFIFSCEADVIVPPDAIEKMVQAAQEHGVQHARTKTVVTRGIEHFDPNEQTFKPAVVTQRYHPRGQDGPTFWWDTLGCSLFPTQTLYEGIDRVTSIYEIDIFVTCEKAGHPRYRPGVDGPDLFIPEHLKDPEDTYGSDVGATPAHAAYMTRVDSSNRKLAGEAPTPTTSPMSQPPAALDKNEPVPSPDGFDTSDAVAIPFADVMLQPEAAKKVMAEERIRLNIGSDWSQISGFLSVDFNPKVSPDVCTDGKDLHMFGDNTVDEIYASHVLEHFTWDDTLAALKEWLRVLRPGGMITVAVPDIEQIYHLYKHGQTWGEYRLPMNDRYVQAVAFGANLLVDELPEMKDLYGGPGHKHQSIFIKDMLLNRVIEAGFVHAHEVVKCFLRSCALGETMVQARKPKEGE